MPPTLPRRGPSFPPLHLWRWRMGQPFPIFWMIKGLSISKKCLVIQSEWSVHCHLSPLLGDVIGADKIPQTTHTEILKIPAGCWSEISWHPSQCSSARSPPKVNDGQCNSWRQAFPGLSLWGMHWWGGRQGGNFYSLQSAQERTYQPFTIKALQQVFGMFPCLEFTKLAYTCTWEKGRLYMHINVHCKGTHSNPPPKPPWKPFNYLREESLIKWWYVNIMKHKITK